MKTVGIILLVIQALALVGGIASGQLMATLGSASFGFLIGFFLPGIVGLVLLNKAKKK